MLVWNAMLPSLPHEPRRAEAVPARTSADVWTRYVPFERLPRILNPPGGYVQNANDPPWYTNLNAPLDPGILPPNIPRPRLSLRSQLSLRLVEGEDRLSVEEVIARKHDLRMLLAERVRDDLVRAVRDVFQDEEVLRAAALLEEWDGTAAAESRGSVLFELWFNLYDRAIRRQFGTSRDREGPDQYERHFYARTWDPDDPLATPAGLGAPDLAAGLFPEAMRQAVERWGNWEVTWGEVHRLRRGKVDLPLGGGSSRLGCFRVIDYEPQPDGTLAASGGDGWILLVEFSDPPQAWSVCAYGQSDLEDSPHYSDQAALFAAGRLKPVYLDLREIESHLLGRYRPGPH